MSRHDRFPRSLPVIAQLEARGSSGCRCYRLHVRRSIASAASAYTIDLRVCEISGRSATTSDQQSGKFSAGEPTLPMADA